MSQSDLSISLINHATPSGTFHNQSQNLVILDIIPFLVALIQKIVIFYLFYHNIIFWIIPSAPFLLLLTSLSWNTALISPAPLISTIRHHQLIFLKLRPHLIHVKTFKCLLLPPDYQTPLATIRDTWKATTTAIPSRYFLGHYPVIPHAWNFLLISVVKSCKSLVWAQNVLPPQESLPLDSFDISYPSRDLLLLLSCTAFSEDVMSSSLNCKLFIFFSSWY